MRVVCLRGGFGFENLTLEERPLPTCGKNQVLVRVRAVSLNFRDVLMARGEYNPRQPLPLVLGSDAAGEVIERGPSVTRVRLGDRVCPIFAERWLVGSVTRDALRSTRGGPLDGTLSEFLVVDEQALVAAPSHLDFTEAACLPCAGVTAHRAVRELGGLQAGQSLVTIGTGGVSLFALSFARALGANIVVVSRSLEKAERARELGATHTLCSRQTPSWGKLARDLCGEGAEQVVEVGGAGTLAESVRAVRPGGTILLIGVLAGGIAELDLRPILMQDVRIQGVFVGSRASFEAMNEFVSKHAVRPVIDRVFAVEDVRAAFERVASGEQFGKVCIEFAM
ncbi:MAG TPA: NAD(P)-dependent alcohol dehydrogenase [Polyangiaceae bacterium]